MACNSETDTAPAFDVTRPWLAEQWVRDIIRCPVTGATLTERTDAATGRVELVSTDATNPLVYPVRDGVPVLLASEARPLESE